MSSIAALEEQITAWARRRPDVIAAALVGSHARGEARPESDVDVVLIVEAVSRYLESNEWLSEFGEIRWLQDEDYGLVQSRRVLYGNGLQIEWGLTDRRWLRVPPDRGTARVIRDGMRTLYDPKDELATLSRSVTV